MKHRETRRRWTARRLIIGFVASLGLVLVLAGPADARKYSGATTSSPISLSADGKYLWSVNPGADTVSVIYTKTNKVIAQDQGGRRAGERRGRPEQPLRVRRERRIGIRHGDPHHAGERAQAAGTPDRRAGSKGQIVTGSEPWNVVVSPNGRRVYVANSGQDTITVIDGTRPRRKRGVIGHVNLKSSVCNDPDRTRHFQPRGLAVSKSNKRLLRHQLLLVGAARRRSRPATPAGRASSAGSASAARSKRISAATARARRSRSGRRSPASRWTPPGTACPIRRPRSRTRCRAS